MEQYQDQAPQQLMMVLLLREVAAAGLTSLEFDQLRKSYQQPAEWTGQRVTIPVSDDGHRAAAERLGLKVASE